MLGSVNIKRINEKSHPLVVGSVTTLDGLIQAEKSSHKDCDIIEVRLDLMPKSLINHRTELRKLLRAIKLPVLTTLRSSHEGGKCTWPLSWRLSFLETILPEIDLIDLELFAAKNCPEKINFFHKQGKIVILSYHDFEKFPGNRFIENKIKKMFEAGADIAKVACYIKSRTSLNRLLTLMQNQTKPVSLMGMGPLATESRVELAGCGSILNYGYLDKPAAPGQIACGDLINKIRKTRIIRK